MLSAELVATACNALFHLTLAALAIPMVHGGRLASNVAVMTIRTVAAAKAFCPMNVAFAVHMLTVFALFHFPAADAPCDGTFWALAIAVAAYAAAVIGRAVVVAEGALTPRAIDMSTVAAEGVGANLSTFHHRSQHTKTLAVRSYPGLRTVHSSQRTFHPHAAGAFVTGRAPDRRIWSCDMAMM